MKNNVNLVLVTVVHTTQAHIIKSQLEANGIPTVLSNEQSSILFFGALGGTRVLVRKEDMPKAKKLVDTFLKNINNDEVTPEMLETYLYEEEPSELVSSNEAPVLNCERCGSKNVSPQQMSRAGIILSILMLGIPLSALKSPNHCFNCQHDWKTESLPLVSGPIQAAISILFIIVGIFWFGIASHFFSYNKKLLETEAALMNIDYSPNIPDEFFEKKYPPQPPGLFPQEQTETLMENTSLTYTYQANGKAYKHVEYVHTPPEMAIGENTTDTSDPNSLRSIIPPHKIGDKKAVYYHPQTPEKVQFSRTNPNYFLTQVGIALLLIIFHLTLFLRYRQYEKQLP